jgi:hypothetical protein
MKPLVLSAQFAAYAWFKDRHPEQTEEDARRYARQNWPGFVDCAPLGLGKLLARIAAVPDQRQRRPRQRRRVAASA